MPFSWIHRLAELPTAYDILFKMTLLLAAGWAAQFIIRSGNPYRRVLLWRGLGVALLATPLLVLISPAIRIPLPAAPASEPIDIKQAPFPETLEPAWAAAGGGVQELSQPPHEPALPASGLMPGPGPHLPSAIHWPQLFGGLWCSGVALLAYRWAQAWLRLRSLIRRSSHAGERCEQELQRARRSLGCARAVQIRMADQPVGPLLAGIRSPVVLLPQGFQSRGPDLPAVVAHELTHVLNRDLIWMAILRGVSVLLWWHPMCWMLCRAHREACEEACDAAAAEFVGNADTYSGILARLALSGMSSSLPVAGVPMARPAEILRRVGRLKSHVHVVRPATVRIISMAGLCVMTVVILSSVRLVGIAAAPLLGTVPALPARVLHFPADRSLGTLSVQDADLKRDMESFYFWTEDGVSDEWERLGPGRGDVGIPAGKRVRLTISPQEWRDLAPLNRLAPDDLFEIVFEGSGMSAEEAKERGFLRVRSAPDSVMTYIGRLTGLRVLNLQSTNVTSKGLRHIGGLQSLECLHLPRTTDDRGMSEVVKLTGLKRLYLRENRLSDEGLVKLTALANIEELAIGGHNVSDEGLAKLAELPKLKYLFLWSDAFTDEGMAYLPRIASLKTLVLFKTQEVTDAGLAEVAKIATLERLSLPWMNQITDAGVAHLSRLSNLKMLNIAHTSMTDAGAEHLHRLANLELLDVPNTLGEAALAGVLAKTPRLQSLRCGGTSSCLYGDALCERISKLTDLRSLSMGGKKVTDEGIAHFGNCRGLRHLSLFDCPFTDKGLAVIGGLENLTTLEIFRANLTTSGLAELNGLSRLRRLRASRVKPGPKAMDVSGLVNLRDFILDGGHDGESLRDEDLACLAHLKHLTRFQISFCRGIGDAGVAHLAGLTGLTRLSIGDDISDAGLAHLAGMRQLQSLTISGNLTEEGLLQLNNPRLWMLDVITPHQMSRDFSARMTARLPNLNAVKLGKTLQRMGAVRARR